ncbi:hypothetical protein [Streptomyces longwoodensis]|uniref:hypothetical protein n=1 Tax=Streptomyces longwoodensis TaxID=68231 RepID=UPI0036FF45E2
MSARHVCIAERCKHSETKRHLCTHRLAWAQYRVREVPCERSFCPHTEAPAPEEFQPPARLAVVPEALVSQAVRNVSALVDHDSAKADEVVRRVLAALGLAERRMPDTLVDHYPDGMPAREPVVAAVGSCPWGKLRRNGDVVMCALDERNPDTDEPGPGHDDPREHAYRRPGTMTHVPFREDDPRAFHAPTWLGYSLDDHLWRTDLRNDKGPTA